MKNFKEIMKTILRNIKVLQELLMPLTEVFMFLLIGCVILVMITITRNQNVKVGSSVADVASQSQETETTEKKFEAYPNSRFEIKEVGPEHYLIIDKDTGVQYLETPNGTTVVVDGYGLPYLADGYERDLEEEFSSEVDEPMEPIIEENV